MNKKFVFIIIILTCLLIGGFFTYQYLATTKEENSSGNISLAKQVVESFLEKRGYSEEYYIYDDGEDSKYYLFAVLIPPYYSDPVILKINKKTQELECVVEITQLSINQKISYIEKERCNNIEEVFPLREKIVSTKKYTSPKDLFEALKTSFANNDFEHFKQLLAGEAKENYNSSEKFQRERMKFEKRGFEYFDYQKPVIPEDEWIPGPKGEKIYWSNIDGFEIGFIVVKSPNGDTGKFLIIRIGDFWKMIED